MIDTKYWDDLIKGLTILKENATGPFPTHCEHDELWVMSDPKEYGPEEIDELSELGFIPNDDGGFVSYHFGSA